MQRTTPSAALFALAAALAAAGCAAESTGSGTTSTPPPVGAPGTIAAPSVTTIDAPGTGAAPTTESPTTLPPELESTTSTTSTTSATAPPVEPDLASVEPALEVVTTLEQPLDVAVRPGDRALYVASKLGRVYRIAETGQGATDTEVYLDLADRVSTNSERGLLGIAFLGDRLYADYSDRDGDSVLASWSVGADGALDLASEETLLVVAQPYQNHNGGDLEVGPDGLLWWALGDGGSSGDPEGNGQDVDTLLGAILRIRPTPDGPAPYEVPADNPFAGGGGAAEIYAYGLRNPWRFHFDPVTGDLWVADVGQNSLEELNVVPAAELTGGLDFGWNRVEGDRPFAGSAEPGDVVPVHTYGRDEGRSVTGGVVYRGAALPDLVGAYLFADYTGGWIDALAVRDGTVVDHRRLFTDVGGVVGFGYDSDGEVIVVTIDGLVLRLVAG